MLMGGQAVYKAFFVIANGEQVLTGILSTSVLYQKISWILLFSGELILSILCFTICLSLI